MKFPLVLTLLCSLSTSLAVAAKTPAADGQAAGTDPCADAAKCKGKFVANLAVGGNAYKNYRPASVVSALAHHSTSAHAASPTPKKSPAASPAPKKGHSTSPAPKKGHSTSLTSKKKNHARRAEDGSEISVTSSDTELTAADSSELVRRHGRDWSLTKRNPAWQGESVPEGGLKFVEPNHGIYTQAMISCTGILAENSRGTVLNHMVCANNPALPNPYGTVEAQYAKLKTMVTEKLGTTGIRFWVSMPAQGDKGFAEVQPVLNWLRRDFPPGSQNTLSTTTREAGIKFKEFEHFTATLGGLAWQPDASDKVQYSQKVMEWKLNAAGHNLAGYPKATSLQPHHKPFTQVY